MTCRHCKREMRIYGRGLCYTCFTTRSIRVMYPRGSHGGIANVKRGDGVDNARRPASCPTSAQPGSVEKIAVMQWRAAMGEEVFHPQDYVERS